MMIKSKIRCKIYMNYKTDKSDKINGCANFDKPDFIDYTLTKWW